MNFMQQCIQRAIVVLVPDARWWMDTGGRVEHVWTAVAGAPCHTAVWLRAWLQWLRAKIAYAAGVTAHLHSEISAGRALRGEVVVCAVCGHGFAIGSDRKTVSLGKCC